MVNVGREALLSIGCIQALRCHTNKCPAGITTQSAWLSRGLDPELKSVRLANYIVSLRKEVLALCRACGVPHPSQISANDIEMIDDRFGAQTLADVLGGRGEARVYAGLPARTAEPTQIKLTAVPPSRPDR
jgi:hypothetical protein